MREMQDLLNELNLKNAIAWLWDIDRRRIAWATEASLNFWQEPTLLDLVARVFGSEDETVIQLEQIRSELVPLEWIERRLLIHAQNGTVRATCKLRPYQLNDGREGIVVEVEDFESQSRDLSEFSLDALGRHAPIPLALYGVDGTLVARNEAAEQLFELDLAANLQDLIIEENAAANLIVRVLADEIASRTLALATRHGDRLHRIVAKRSRHPATGAPAINVAFEDVEDSRRLWSEAMRALQNLTPMPETIFSKSSPKEVPTAAVTASNILQFRGPENGEEKNLRNFFDVFPEAIFRIDRNGDIASANRLAHELVEESNESPSEGGPQSIASGNSFSSIFDTKTRAKIDEYISNYEDSSAGRVAFNRDCSFAHELTPLGTLNLTIVPALYDGQPHFYSVLIDRSFEKAREDEMRQAREDAQGKNRQKSEFIANASHEMRTPLNAIVGFSEIMAKEQMGPLRNERYAAYARDIHKSSLHLLSLVDDLLDLAKIESGKLDLEISDVDVGSTIKDCVSLIAPLASKANLSFSQDIQSGLPHIAANERSLRQILINLFSNGIKFSAPHKEIRVSAKLEADGSLVIGIQDQGVGMTEADLKIALEPFGQVGQTNARHAHIGTGLGLPLAKALAEANHAEFDIISAPGKGTMVQLTFPSTLVLAE